MPKFQTAPAHRVLRILIWKWCQTKAKKSSFKRDLFSWSLNERLIEDEAVTWFDLWCWPVPSEAARYSHLSASGLAPSGYLELKLQPDPVVPNRKFSLPTTTSFDIPRSLIICEELSFSLTGLESIFDASSGMLGLSWAVQWTDGCPWRGRALWKVSLW